MQNFRRPNLYQLREIAVILTFIGGLIDAYTFIQRGGVLAAGQTGNIIFLSVDIANHNLPGVFTKISTIIGFSLGVATVPLLHKKLSFSHYWRLTTLLPGILVCAIVGCLPLTIPNIFIVPVLAYSMAVQNVAFSEIEGHGYNNVFSTGNLKKAVLALSQSLINRNKLESKTAIIYFELVLGFACGAMVSAILQKFFHVQTIWFAALLLAMVEIAYAWLLVYREHNK